MSVNFIFLYLPGMIHYFVIGTNANRAILNGNRVEGNEFTYQVSLQIHGHVHHCGGGIIDNYFILTAAHCVVKDNVDINDTSMSILAGTNNMRKRGKRVVIVNVVKIFVPTVYHPADVTATGDIAVLKLSDSLGLNKLHKRLKRLQLPNKYDTYAGKTVKIAGYGWDWIKVQDDDKSIGNNSDNRLRFAKAVVLKFRQSGYPPAKLPDRLISAKIEQRRKNLIPRGACFGDSGGPLVYDGKIIIGILSTSPKGCTEKEFGAIYTRISHYLDFIQHAMHDIHHEGIRTKVLYN